MTKITSKFKTIATVGFTGSVSSKHENRAAHGGVCHLQARRNAAGELVGRRVNSNGRHQEVSEAFLVDARQIDEWERIEKGAK